MNMTTDYIFRVSEQGSAQLRAAIKGLGVDFKETKVAGDAVIQTTERHGKASSSLADFIKRENVAHRQRAFVMREGRDLMMLSTVAIMAMGMADSNASEAKKKMLSTLTQSVMVFQTSAFAMSALGIATGGWGLAIAGVLGVGAGLLSFLGDADEKTRAFNKSMDKQTELLLELGLISKQEVMRKIAEDIEEAVSKLNAMSFAPTERAKRFGITGIMAGSSTPQEYIDQTNIILGLQRNFQKLFTDVTKDGAKDRKTAIAEEAKAYLENLEKQTAALTRFLNLQHDKYMRESIFPGMLKSGNLKLTNPNEIGYSGLKDGLGVPQKDIDANNAKKIEYEQDRNELVKERLKTELKLLSDAQMEMRIVREMNNVFSGISDVIVELGGSTDNWFSRLSRIFQIVQEIQAVMEAINTLESIASFLGLLHEGGIIPQHQGGLAAHQGLALPTTYGGRREVMVKAYAGEEILSEDNPRHRNNRYSKGDGSNVSITINAVDARSFDDWINIPANRRTLTNTVLRGLRSN